PLAGRDGEPHHVDPDHPGDEPNAGERPGERTEGGEDPERPERHPRRRGDPMEPPVEPDPDAPAECDEGPAAEKVPEPLAPSRLYRRDRRALREVGHARRPPGRFARSSRIPGGTWCPCRCPS